MRASRARPQADQPGATGEHEGHGEDLPSRGDCGGEKGALSRGSTGTGWLGWRPERNRVR
jgi:hypothetical protein